MAARHIHTNRAVYSASNVREALAQALTEIKDEDSLTDADIGAVLGKSADRAREYRLGTSTMDAETYGRGKREWSGRFCGYFERLCVDSRPGYVNDHLTLTHVLNAAAEISKALDDGEITPAEIRDNRQKLEQAKDALECLLSKLKIEAA